MAIKLNRAIDQLEAIQLLETNTQIQNGKPALRDDFTKPWPLSFITDLRINNDMLLMVLKGDKLEAATPGLMQDILHQLDF